jgi:general secretion pathway protein A
MYEDYYGLTERPFTLLPDPDFLYMSPQHKLARSYLEYGLTSRLGFIVLTGEIGTGKTTLVKSILKTKHSNKQRIGVLYQTSFAAEDLLELLLREFSVRGHHPTRVARLAAFNQFLQHAHRQEEHVILIVDEAQNLGPEALEELRLLSNLQAEKEPLLQVVLVGQPSLRDRLSHPLLRQLAQRVAVHYHINPLDQETTKDYIRFRLARAGGSGIFTESALDKIFGYTQGVPRRINTWCDLALVAGFAEGKKEIDDEFLEKVVSLHVASLEGQDEGKEDLTGAFDAPSKHHVPPDKWEGFQERRDPAMMAGAHRSGMQHLDGEVKLQMMDLSGRLGRLEDLFVEITTQLVPALTKIINTFLPSDQQQATTIPPFSSSSQEIEKEFIDLETKEEPAEEPPSRPLKKLWSKILGNKEGAVS